MKERAGDRDVNETDLLGLYCQAINLIVTYSLK